MLSIYKTLQVSLVVVVVLTCSQAVMAQQWPIGQVPVENAVPQYRPRNVQSRVPSNPASNQGALPFDFFNDNTAPPVPEVKRQLVQRPSSLKPVVSSPSGLRQELLEVNPLKSQVTQPGGVKPMVAKPVTPVKPAGAKKLVEKKTPAKKLAAKKSDKKKVAKKKKNPKLDPVLNNEIYRDQAVYPIDPRKPNWPCAGGKCKQPGCSCKSSLALGNQGRPYREGEPGGCECDSRKPTKHPNFSVHWPRPFSARIDARFPEAANQRYANPQKKRIVDVFDGLATIKISNYKRTDNGYSGRGSDRYGCLGESKLR